MLRTRGENTGAQSTNAATAAYLCPRDIRSATASRSSIAANPIDWHMLQPLWIADLPDERQQALAESRT